MANDISVKDRPKPRAKTAKKSANRRKKRKTPAKKPKVAGSSRKRRPSKRALPGRAALAVHAAPTLIQAGAAASQPTRMILLPPRGLRADSSSLSLATQDFMASLHAGAQPARGAKPSAGRIVLGASVPQLKDFAPDLKVEVLDSIAEDGAKLVNIAPADLARIRMAQPGLRFAPLLEYELPLGPRSRQIQVLARPAVRSSGVRFMLVSPSGQPVAAARVVAFTYFASRTGAEADSDAKGRVQLALSSSTRIERLYIY